MNYPDLITMLVLVLVPAVAAWWWIQKVNGQRNQGYGSAPSRDTGATKSDPPK